jgi:HD-like signal output (HDOD) protein
MFRWLKRLLSGTAVALAPPARTPLPRQAAEAPAERPAAHSLAYADELSLDRFSDRFSDPCVAAGTTAQEKDEAASGAGHTAMPPVSFEQLDHINGAWNGWLFDRHDQDGLDLTETESRVLEALASILSAQQSGAALVRRMPGLIPQLLQSLRSDSFSGAALARTISSDVVLVAAVIRLANNCHQGTANAITSVEHAVILIGQEGLRQLITTVAFRPIIDMNSGFYTRRLAPRLWEHAERCAISARQLAAPMGILPFDAFLAGMLHNVGMIVSLRIMDQMARGERKLGSEMFLAQLARATRALACSIAREWHFPESVAQALSEQGGLHRGAQMSPLGRLLKLTDYLGKVRLLVENELLDESNPELFSGLPANAAQCYSALAASREQAAPA